MLIENLKYLRKQHQMTQFDLAEKISIPRSTLGEYERGNTEPAISTLIKMANVFDVTVDALVQNRISDQDLEIMRNNDVRILAISTDFRHRSNIELVNTKAEAGYLESFSDPEYIRDLPKISFPNIPEGTYRGFEIRGDSMLPMESGSIVICKYVESLNSLKDDRTYVVVSASEGVVYKRLKNNKEKKVLTLISDNDLYHPYALPYSEVAEIWQYYAHLSFSDSKSTFNFMLEEKLNDIQRKVTEIRDHISA